MKTFVVAYRTSDLLARAWHTYRCEAEDSKEAVRQCCIDIPYARIEDVWELLELQQIPGEEN